MESSSSRPARLSTAERKRLTDRKAQRQRRERIKTYIARLEKTLEDLTAASGNGMEATLLKQLEQQRLKTERLTNVISHIREVLEDTQGSSSPAQASSSSSPLLPSGEVPADSNPEVVLPPEVARQQQQQQPSSDKDTSKWVISKDLTTNISLHSQNPSNSGLRNYFEVINEMISKVASEPNSILPSTPADDDDLAIRAILNGWDSIHTRGQKIDRVWGLVQALDQGIFSRTGLVERVAIVRLMRSMFKWNFTPLDHNQRPIPSFMLPTVTQSMIPHPPLVDYFAWPNLRDHLIVSGITSISEVAAAQYVSHIRLKWPFELRDICKYHVTEDKYRFSEEFESVYYDLQSWTITSQPLQMLVENGPPPGVDVNGNLNANMNANLDGGEVVAGSYWDRLLDGNDHVQI